MESMWRKEEEESNIQTRQLHTTLEERLAASVSPVKIAPLWIPRSQPFGYINFGGRSDSPIGSYEVAKADPQPRHNQGSNASKHPKELDG